jgi:hypothetical protein
MFFCFFLLVDRPDEIIRALDLTHARNSVPLKTQTDKPLVGTIYQLQVQPLLFRLLFLYSFVFFFEELILTFFSFDGFYFGSGNSDEELSAPFLFFPLDLFSPKDGCK